MTAILTCKYLLFIICLDIGVDLTSSYDIDDAREFVETYVAFSVSHMNGAEPTLQTLADFERRELNSIKSKPKETATRKHTNVAEQDAEMEDDDIMDSYICRTPKVCILKCSVGVLVVW